MSFVDFTGYTESDPGADITVTTNKCDVVTIPENVKAYVRKDYAINYFNNFNHLFKSTISSADNNSYCAVWGVAEGSRNSIIAMLF